MLPRSLIKKNIISFSILLFLIIIFFIHKLKPNIFYNQDGTFRDFGLGFQKKTAVPIWFFTIITAFLSYLFILYYITYPKIQY